MPERSAQRGRAPAMIDAQQGKEEVFMWLASGVVTEWVKCLHQFGAIIMSKGEEVAWKEGGPGEHLHTTSLFIYRHVRALQSPPPPLCAGEFTVRPFNFTEIGPWQLCHADEEVFEKSGTLSHLIWPSSDAPKPPPPPSPPPHLRLPSSP